ncbi:Electron transfer flavoprotein subunit alpha [Corynebacterium occultum]|uniref:Electron transfer flavoprotein subunit alpha n=1 Tax=Corynebacterium occultum TaxID=2675219 RepID=A0A6B8WAT3_9CORY|nr:electron transfer flavoprotein subunit alpha/FixB family protein [Corynebacterium occultum]QGU07110.1 Electron transfer flavoprotein subunit alpha [Corynebacterium occultum]
MSNAYVLVEQQGGILDPVTAELITAARNLGEVTAVVVGKTGTHTTLAGELAAIGAAAVIAAESDSYDSRLILPEVDTLHTIAYNNPGPIVVAATTEGNEIAGRLAVRLASGVLSDVIAINADRTATHSIFGDTVSTTAAVGGSCPVYTLRPGATEADPIPAAGTVQVIALPEATAKDVTVTSFTPSEVAQRPALSQAKAVVAGGRGVGSVEGFTDLVEPLADLLDGAVGATRDAVDEKYYGPNFQIGQTGETVSPDLYIALGISGAIQHTSGMQTAKTIVAINEDEDAAIFQIADLGIVGDLFEITPKLIEEIKQRKN